MGEVHTSQVPRDGDPAGKFGALAATSPRWGDERDPGVAVVIDPVRDVGQYLDLAIGESVELAWALETHVHNDFVSGARELVASGGMPRGER